MQLAMALVFLLTASGPEKQPSTETAVVPAPRTWRCAIVLQPGEVLVIRGTRREQGRVVLETEEILVGAAAQAGFDVEVRPRGVAAWQVFEPAIEQHLANVQLSRWAPAPRKLEVAFAPVPGANGRSYTLQWLAHIERWDTARKRHPDLPVTTTGGWRVRFVSYAEIKSTAGAASRRR